MTQTIVRSLSDREDWNGYKPYVNELLELACVASNLNT